MSHLLFRWMPWLVSAAAQDFAWIFIQHGLALLLQTSLLLGAGLWALRILQKRGSRVRGFVARALVATVLVSVGITGLSVGRAPRQENHPTALWQLTLPREAESPALAAGPSVTDGLASPAMDNSLKPGATAPSIEASYNSEEPEAPANPVGALSPATNHVEDVVTRGTVWQKFALLASVAWLTGSGALLVWLVACHAALLLLRRGAKPVTEPEAVAALAGVCTSLEVRAPRLLEHATVSSPFLTGLMRPAVLLPSGAPLGADELRAVLLHEVAHLKRRDLWWNAAGRTACALLWPQPLLWLLCRRLEQINEEECDEAVLYAGCERGQYARCLLQWAERMTSRRAERVAGAGVLTGRTSLSRRVQLILDNANPKGRRITARLRWTAVVATVAAVVAMPLMVSIDAAPAKQVALMHYIDSKQFTVTIGGVSKNGLDFVSIQNKLANGTVYQSIAARRANLLVGIFEHGQSKMWTFKDVTIQNYDLERGIVPHLRVRSPEIVLHMDEVSPFLRQQLLARPETPSLKEQHELMRQALPSLEEWKAVRAWSQGRGHAALAGVVRDERGQPVAGAKVAIEVDSAVKRRIAKSADPEIFAFPSALSRRERGLVRQETVTDKDGQYAFAGLAGGFEYTLDMPHNSRASTPEPNDPLATFQLEKSIKVVAREGATTRASRLRLFHMGLIRVRLEDEATGRPLPGILVVAKDPPYYYQTLRHESATTDPRGEVVLRLERGRVSVTIAGVRKRGMTETLAYANGTLYQLAHRAKVSIDGAAPRRGFGSTELTVVKGRTRDVVMRLQPYVAAAPQTKVAESVKPASQQLALQHFKSTETYQVYIGGMVDGVLQSLRFQHKKNGRVSDVITARTARHESGGSQRWLLTDGSISDFGEGRHPGGVSSTFKRLIVTLPDATEFLAQQTHAKPEPAAPGSWEEIQKITRDSLLQRGLVHAWANDRGRGRATVTGRVLDDDGAPVPGARVSIMMSNEAVQRISRSEQGLFGVLDALPQLPQREQNLFSQSVVTADDGTYKIAGLAGGMDYVVRVPAANTNLLSGQTAPLPALVLVAAVHALPREGETTAVRDMRMTSGGVVRVRVVDAASGATLPGVTVLGQAKYPRSSSLPVQLVETNAAGESVFRLPAGPSNIFLTSRQTRPRQPAMTQLSNGIRYSLRDNLEVTIDGGAPRSSTNSIDFDIEKGATREIIVELPRYFAPKPTSAPKPTPPPRLVPPPAGRASLVGRVVDNAGRPMKGIPVVAMIQRAAQWKLLQGAGLAYSNGETPNWRQKWDSIQGVLGANAVTRADGSYRLDGLTTAPYNVIIGSPSPYGKRTFGFRPPSGWVAPAVEGAWAREGVVTRRAQPMELSSGALIRGRVVDKTTGQPVGGVLIGSNGPQIPNSCDSVFAAESDASGWFTFRVAAGTTSLYIGGPDGFTPNSNLVYADTHKSAAHALRIRTNRGLYGGSDDVEYVLDGGKPQYGLNFGTKGDERIQVSTHEGEVKTLTLRLRQLAKG